MCRRKLVSAILVGSVVLGLFTGCGADTDSNGTDSSQPETQAEDQNTANTGNDTANTGNDMAAKDGKTLVVYFSASGNTERVGDIIAEITGADVFAVEPREPYSEEDLDYNNEDSRVSKEHGAPDTREVELVSTEVENWDSYETVFIGYPIWWGNAAWPLDGFVKANDFTGKTVIPFCTSASSEMGESGKMLADMAGTGDWQEGIRFRSGASEDDVRDWVLGSGKTGL